MDKPHQHSSTKGSHTQGEGRSQHRQEVNVCLRFRTAQANTLLEVRGVDTGRVHRGFLEASTAVCKNSCYPAVICEFFLSYTVLHCNKKVSLTGPRDFAVLDGEVCWTITLNQTCQYIPSANKWSVHAEWMNGWMHKLTNKWTRK